MAEKRTILIVCTANASRSQMAERLLREIGGDRFEALSAGASPIGFIHRSAVRVMAEAGLPLTGQRSKSVAEFTNRDDIDLVLTVCDSARQSCPIFPGTAVRAHWSIEDPTFVELAETENRDDAFRATRELLRGHFEKLVALPFDELSPDELVRRVEAIAAGQD